MAHEGIFATADECKAKAGAGATATATSEANINQFCKEVEGYINTLCEYNFSDNFATLNADVQGILTEAETAFVGMNCVQYNVASYPSTRAAENIINLNWRRFNQCIKLLQDQKKVKFIADA